VCSLINNIKKIKNKIKNKKTEYCFVCFSCFSEANCEVLANLFHSLDIWHKSIKLTAKISAAAKIKGCEKLVQWVEPVRNHFWHCAETCEGDVDKLKDKWLGIVHHVCGEMSGMKGCVHTVPSRKWKVEKDI